MGHADYILTDLDNLELQLLILNSLLSKIIAKTLNLGLVLLELKLLLLRFLL